MPSRRQQPGSPGKTSRPSRAVRRGGSPSRTLPISLMLVDDHPLWREMLRTVLEHKRVGRVVAEASNGQEAIEQARRTRPDVVVMDIDLPKMNGVEATRLLVAERPDVKVLVLSASDARSQVIEAVRAGASGYLLKVAGSGEVADAVKRIHAGELVFPPALADVVMKEFRGGEPQDGAAPVTEAPPEIENAFRQEGEFWTLAYDGEVVRLKDRRGLRYLARLLRSAGREIHVLDLAGAPGERAGAGAVTDRGEVETRVGFGDAGEVLDPKARAAYKRRLEELRDDMEEAEEWGDPERVARAKQEMDFLAHELSAAVGIGGRVRRAGSAAERARVNVTKSIRAALAGIAAAHPALGQHLDRSIRTGNFCSYNPDEPTTWVL